jgi:hypothetical protein
MASRLQNEPSSIAVAPSPDRAPSSLDVEAMESRATATPDRRQADAAYLQLRDSALRWGVDQLPQSAAGSATPQDPRLKKANESLVPAVGDDASAEWLRRRVEHQLGGISL